jgi:hypothetical protein
MAKQSLAPEIPRGGFQPCPLAVRERGYLPWRDGYNAAVYFQFFAIIADKAGIRAAFFRPDTVFDVEAEKRLFARNSAQGGKHRH